MQVLTFLLKRFGWMIVTVWIVFTVSFFLMRQIPGGPFNGERVLSEAVRARLEARCIQQRELLSKRPAE